MPIATPTWINRIWQEYRAGNLTRAARDVLLTLHTFRGHGGVAWPSQVTLGERANCDERTVRRALVAARDLGLVHWTERRVRAG
jgi:Helix-turn-helix domain